MKSFLISSSGIIYLTRPGIIARACCYNREEILGAGQDIAAVFVVLGEHGARIAFWPEFVSRRALSGLYTFISQQKPSRIAVAGSVHLTTWEVIRGVERAIVRIELLVAEARNPTPQPLVTTERLPIELCRDLAGGKLLPVLEAWGQRQGRWEPELYGRFEELQLLPDTIISERPRASDRMLIRHWGARITTFGEEWVRIAPGRDIEDVPNAEIGSRRAAMHRQTVMDGMPNLAAIAGVLPTPDAKWARLQFHRLCMPWWAEDGVVLTTAFQIGRRMAVSERPTPMN